MDKQVYSGDLLPVWRDHFSQLAVPREKEHYTNHRFENASKNLEVIRVTLHELHTLPILITKPQVHSAIEQLKMRKE